MDLELFDYIEEIIKIFEKDKSKYVAVANQIEDYFEEKLCEGLDGYLNINCRVKTQTSLREKLIRNRLYKNGETPDYTLRDLSDLIGVRIECRFSTDEEKIYKEIVKFFNVNKGEGYFSNEKNPQIMLLLNEEQPQKQKNGFEIYKIDGLFIEKNEKIKFELQIKSLVNMFWGEIEHKVIYKNNNYMLMDKLFKDMMTSIKENLSMIDNQLLILYEQFNNMNSLDAEERKEQLQAVLSKIIYDIFARRMKTQIGFQVDFRKSCDTIMKYMFRVNDSDETSEYTNVLVKTTSRLNEISKNEMDFTKTIKFSREIVFTDSFEQKVGSAILANINSDFHWNVFFRILFEIEKGNNAEDFEAFLEFTKKRVFAIPTLQKLFNYFDPITARDMVAVITAQIAEAFTIVGDIDFIYDDNLEDLETCIGVLVNTLSFRVDGTEEWEEHKQIYKDQILKEILKIYE